MEVAALVWVIESLHCSCHCPSWFTVHKHTQYIFLSPTSCFISQTKSSHCEQSRTFVVFTCTWYYLPLWSLFCSWSYLYTQPCESINNKLAAMSGPTCDRATGHTCFQSVQTSNAASGFCPSLTGAGPDLCCDNRSRIELCCANPSDSVLY